MPADRRIPVVVVTGFLGSGKSTLVNGLISSGALSDTAVVVNELGSVGIDHHLLRAAEDQVRVMEGGCVCCSLRGGLTDTLQDLFLQAVRRRIPRFSRVLIETTGLADPAPVVFTLRHDPFLSERYVYAGAVVVVDAVHAVSTRSAQPEWMRQLALADWIVIGKADLAEAHALRELEQELARLAPGVPASRAAIAHAVPLDLDALGPYAGTRRPVSGWLAAAVTPEAAPIAQEGGMPRGRRSPPGMGSGHAPVRTVALPLARPLAAGRFLAGMAALQERHGDDLLRIKGIVRFDGQAGRLAVFHGVHRQSYPLADLPDDGKTPCAVVMIARESGFAAISAELGELASLAQVQAA